VNPRWEYLVLVMEHRTELKTRSHLMTGLDLTFPPQPEEKYWARTTTHFIFRPGADDPEELAGTPTEAPDNGTYTCGLLNQLGAEGWELVSDVVSHSTVSTFWGWPNTSSFPIHREWTLKRMVGDDASA
jgi:hypothetical protein